MNAPKPASTATDGHGAKRPAAAIGLRTRRRVSGEKFLVGVVDERLVLEPGTVVNLRRLHDGQSREDGPEFALVLVRPTAPPSAKDLAAAARDRCDGIVMRNDPRDALATAPRTP